MEEPKYSVELTESELLLIGQKRSNERINKRNASYFWYALILTMILVVEISRFTHSPLLPFLGFIPLVAYFVFNSRINKRINHEAAEFVEKVKTPGPVKTS
jgi:ACR3 family arsenite efflux pump ArsB